MTCPACWPAYAAVLATLGFGFLLDTTVSPTRSLEVTPTSTPTSITCTGDCNGDGVVLINELMLCINIVLDIFGVDACEACDPNGDGRVEISEVITGVNNYFLDACGA